MTTLNYIKEQQEKRERDEVISTLFETAQAFAKDKDKKMIDVGMHLTAASEMLTELEEENADLKKSLEVVCEAGLHDKERVLPAIVKQTEILQEMKELNELFGRERKKEVRRVEAIFATAAKSIYQKLITNDSVSSRINALAGLIMLGIAVSMGDKSLVSRALKLSKISSDTTE